MGRAGALPIRFAGSVSGRSSLPHRRLLAAKRRANAAATRATCANSGTFSGALVRRVSSGRLSSAPALPFTGYVPVPFQSGCRDLPDTAGGGQIPMATWLQRRG